MENCKRFIYARISAGAQAGLSLERETEPLICKVWLNELKLHAADEFLQKKRSEINLNSQNGKSKEE